MSVYFIFYSIIILLNKENKANDPWIMNYQSDIYGEWTRVQETGKKTDEYMKCCNKARDLWFMSVLPFVKVTKNI